MQSESRYQVTPMTLPAGAPTSDRAGASSRPAQRCAEPGAFRQALARHAEALRDGEREMDAAMARMRSGRAPSQAELLDLQATVYEHSQRVDVATRVVDRSAAALRQLLNTQL